MKNLIVAFSQPTVLAIGIAIVGNYMNWPFYEQVGWYMIGWTFIPIVKG